MKWVKLTFAVLAQLVAIAVVVALVAAAESRFEQLVVCALILIYVKLSASIAHTWHMSAVIERASVSRFLELKRLLRADVSAEIEGLQVSDNQLEVDQKFHFIRLVGMGACGLIALLALLNSL